MERDCERCVHHATGSCDQWDCKFETLQDVINREVKATLERMDERNAMLEGMIENAKSELFSELIEYANKGKRR